MSRYILRRFIFFGLTLILTSVLIFILTRILPGDVCSIKLGGTEATPETIAACERDLGLDQPLPIQYINWATNFAQGDWGNSFVGNESPIRPELMQRLENSGRLALLTLIISVPLAILLGIVAGLNEGNFIDATISIATLSFVSLPEFVTSIFLINTIALNWSQGWDWLPFELRASARQFDPNSSFVDSLPYIILPALSATFVLVGYITRLTRAGVIEELKQDYVRTAELKGMPYWQVISKHVLRNALLPTITIIAISIGWLMSGLVVVEQVFQYQGVGLYLLNGISRRDLPRIQAVIMVTVFIFLMVNFLADLLYAYLNPRIRLDQ
ncbi:MAG: peptide ABC transporter permease [Phototrophicales bacterium]|nr:MAG: peptide ABC transporter permease [Phototrophicales bacterium]